MKRLTVGRRLDLGLKLWGYALALTVLSLILAITGGILILGKASGLGTSVLVAGAFCFILSHLTFFISIRIERH